MDYKNENGLKRNWLRFKFEWKAFVVHWKDQRNSHAPVTNFFVEFCWVVFYLAGYVWLFTNLLAIVAIAYLLYR